MHLKFLPFTNDTISAAIVERNLQVCNHSLVEVCTHAKSFETAAWFSTFEELRRLCRDIWPGHAMSADCMLMVDDN